MGLFSRLFNSGSSKKKDDKVHDHSKGRTFAPYPKRKDPNAKRNNKFGPKKD